MFTLLALILPTLVVWELLERYPMGLDSTQRWAGAMVLGPVGWTTAVWLQSRWSGRIETGVGLAILLIGLAPALWSLRRLAALKPSPSTMLGVAAAGLFGRLAWRQFFYDNNILYAGSSSLSADGALHLSLIHRWVAAESDCWLHPLYAGDALVYHYFSDLLSATLVKLTGEPWPWSLAWPCLWFSLAGTLLLFAHARAHLDHTPGALLAVALVLFSGSVNLFGPGPHGFTDVAQQGYYFSNFITGVLLPQRSTLMGWPLLLLALALMRGQSRAGLALACGVGACLPLIHFPAWLTLILLSLAYGGRSRLPALACLVGILPWLSSGPAGGFLESVYLQIGWMGSMRSDFLVLFWLKQFGGVLVLLGVYYHSVPPDRRRAEATAYVPIGMLFLLTNVINFSPNPWDGCKILHFWLMLSSPLLAGAALWLWKEKSKTLCLLLVASATVTGGLDVGRQLLNKPSRKAMVGPAGLSLADWLGRHTPVEALIAVEPLPGHPVTTLSGRRVLLGYPNWLKSHGYLSLVSRKLENQLCLNGDPGAMERNGVDYVVLSRPGATPENLRLLTRFGNFSVWGKPRP